MEGRNELFQKLKPPCVALGQAALTLSGSGGNVQTATSELEKIRRILESALSNSLSPLDAKLAEYVFFPIAQLLKVSQKLSIRSLELCLQCIAALIEKGWRQDIPSALAAQLLILCSMLAEKKPKGLSFAESSNELRAWSFWCMYYLFSVISASPETTRLLRSESNFPQLGQTISVILDGIRDGESVGTEIAASSSLRALVENVIDTEVQASFLPGIMSKLTKVLTPQTKSRRNHRVLIECLGIVQKLLHNTMSDTSMSSKSAEQSKQDRRSIIDGKWQESAATQLKPALSNMLRLKLHSRNDVQDAVAALSLEMLRHCRKTLDNCSRMAIDMLVSFLAGRDEIITRQELVFDIQRDPSMTTLLQSQLYDWLHYLPTTMQGSDEPKKTKQLQQVMAAYGLLQESGSSTNTIDSLLANTLRDSVVLTLAIPGSKQERALPHAQIQSLGVRVSSTDLSNVEFSMPLARYRGQEEVLVQIENLTNRISRSSSPGFVGELFRSLQQSRGEEQVAIFWLLQTAVHNLMDRKSSIDDLLNFQEGPDLTVTEQLEELYAFSLSILDDSSEEPHDTRLKSLALRSIAMRAQEAGQDFSYELVDALYPILYTLAGPEVQLQRDSIAALNVVGAACGYSSVKDLVVENVDYLTNAVALKLNDFDVTPQAPQVLLMMVRLAGPTLLPYLEDTVESIFAALENYHGYPLLVELLFQVLSVMAEEGARTAQLAITNAGDEVISSRLDQWQPTDMEDISTVLLRKATQAAKEDEAHAGNATAHPQKPWKDLDNIEGVETTDKHSENDGPHDEIQDAEVGPPAPKTYHILLKINELTQHFLPSASSSLRSRLLTLIETTVPAIAKHEDLFLPLINTLWPEIVSRLDDEEQHIVALALDVIGTLCEYAGDFMRTRITQIWPRLREIYHDLAIDMLQSVSHDKQASASSKAVSKSIVPPARLKQAVQAIQSSPATYSDTGSRILWTSLVTALAHLVMYTRVSPDIFDDALEMAEPVLDRADIRSAFTRENADAVWLCEIKKGDVLRPTKPSLPADFPWRFADVPG